MDAYEATKVVFSRIHALDPDNAANIMGMLLVQDHGDKEMIRLAFGPEALLHSVVLRARKELQGLLPRHNSSAPSSTPMLFSDPPSPASSWPAAGRTNSSSRGSYSSFGGDSTTHEIHADLISGNNLSSSSPSNDGAMLFPYGATGTNTWPPYRRNCSSPMADDDVYYLGSEASCWRPPCLYHARGYCKNGSACRFQHADDYYPPVDDHIKADSATTTEELFSNSSPRLMSSTLLMAASAAAPRYGAASVVLPPTSPGRSINGFLVQHHHQQQQRNESQRAAAAAAATLMLGADDVDRSADSYRCYATSNNPAAAGSRQIYLTFPADSTFREEDVSSYFSIYGPVQDVRIPYQHRRMFGFVTFVHPETVKLILAKGNPHFVCDARVLVKPYKEKGKIPDKKQHPLDFPGGCPTPTGLDASDPYDLRPLGPRMLFSASPEARQQAVELQQAIELQGSRFMGLQLLHLKNRFPLPPPTVTALATTQITSTATVAVPTADPEEPQDKRSWPLVTAAADHQLQAAAHSAPCGPVSAAAAAKEEAAAADAKRSPDKVCDFQESADHNLPDNPFASAAEPHSLSDDTASLRGASILTASSPSFFPHSPPVDMASRTPSCFLALSRFSSGHGAVGK